MKFEVAKKKYQELEYSKDNLRLEFDNLQN